MADTATNVSGKSSRSPLYKQIANVLREEIKTKYAPTDSLPPQRELVQRFSASYLTVNNAIKELVGEGLVTRTVGHGTYVCDRKNTSRGLISVLTSVDPLHMQPMVSRIERELSKSRLRPVLLGGHSNFDEEKRAFDEMGQFKEAGVIIYSMFARKFTARIKTLLDSGMPIVTLNWHIAECDCVRVNHRHVGKLQAQYVINQGCKRILFIGTKLKLDLKLLGFLNTLAEKDYAIEPIQIGYVGCEPGDAGEQKVLKQIPQIVRKAFSGGSPPDGVVIFGDRYLHLVVNELKTMGIAPGKDVTLVGTDNRNLRGFPHATVDENNGQIGQHAAKLLLDRIEGRYNGPPRTVNVEPRLVIYD